MNYKFLVVDDDESTQTTYKTILEFYDFEVETASNGIECLEKVDDFQPDIILLDLIMPDMTGFDVLKVLKSKRENETFKGSIVVSSVTTSFKDIANALKLGADDFFFKHHELELVRYRMIVALTKLLLKRGVLDNCDELNML